MKKTLIALALVVPLISHAGQFTYPEDIKTVGWTSAQESRAYANLLTGLRDNASDPASVTIKPKDVVLLPKWPLGDGTFDDQYRTAIVKYRAKNGYGALQMGMRICKLSYQTQQVDHCMSPAD
jgi:hypothetical protein